MARRQGDGEGAATKKVPAPFFVLPDYLEDWALMTKKEFLAVREIYQYQEMTVAEISAVFFQLGVQKGANLFYLMLQSYKITARVASAAYGFFKEWRDKSNGIFAEEERLAEALHDYSPDNFPEFHNFSTLEFAASCFEQFYNEACTKQTKEEVEELIFEWTKKLQDQLEEKRAGVQKATVEKVVIATKRTPVTSG
jgi:hypothetical protein